MHHPLPPSPPPLFTFVPLFPSNSYLMKSLEFGFETRAPHQTQPEEKTYLRFLGERSPRCFKTQPLQIYISLRVYRDPLSKRLSSASFSQKLGGRKRNIDVSAIELDKNGGKSKGHGFRLRNYGGSWASIELTFEETAAGTRYIRAHRTKLISWKKNLAWYNVIVNGVIIDVTVVASRVTL